MRLAVKIELICEGLQQWYLEESSESVKRQFIEDLRVL